MPPGPFSLMAKDEADLAVIAAAIQDALLPPREMDYRPEEKRFALLVNRFCWERAPMRATTQAEEGARDASFADIATDGAERVLSLLVIERVRAVRRRNLESRPASGFFSLLTLALDKTATGLALDLVFAGGGRVRLEIEAIAVYLRDVGASWPTASRPRHEVDRP